MGRSPWRRCACRNFFPESLSKTREGWQVGPTSATKTDCWNGKGYLPYNQMTLPRTTYGANNNVRIIRYAEVLLMNSEAKVRLGKMETQATTKCAGVQA